MMERHVSIPKPFSTGDITEWFQRFEICCKANGWNDETKAVKLPTLLEGEALGKNRETIKLRRNSCASA